MSPCVFSYSLVEDKSIGIKGHPCPQIDRIPIWAVIMPIANHRIMYSNEHIEAVLNIDEEERDTRVGG